MGFDSTFIDGCYVPLPDLVGDTLHGALEGGRVYDYTHFSIVMHQERRLAIYTAHNIDGKNLESVRRSGQWNFDSRIEEKYQAGNDLYRNNPWDRGHLVRRTAVAWGSEAEKASNDTFFYTNATPQHQNFNQDEWLELENWVLGKAEQEKQRTSVFTGPVFSESDEEYRGIQIPAAFWKIMVVKKADNQLSAVAFLMKQSEMWEDRRGKDFLNITLYQVSIALLEEIAGLSLSLEIREGDVNAQSTEKQALKNFDPMATKMSDVNISWPIIKSPDDITL